MLACGEQLYTLFSNSYLPIVSLFTMYILLDAPITDIFCTGPIGYIETG